MCERGFDEGKGGLPLSVFLFTSLGNTPGQAGPPFGAMSIPGEIIRYRDIFALLGSFLCQVLVIPFAAPRLFFFANAIFIFILNSRGLGTRSVLRGGASRKTQLVFVVIPRVR